LPLPPGDGENPMKCPFCGHLQDKVVDSRESKEGDAIRRRRECLQCERRFTTYERIDEVPYMVIKKDGRREKFDRQKVLGGLLKACEKRPVSMAKLSELVNRVESKVSDSPDREIATTDIGEFLMESLRELDKIAYVRFASVYRDFQDEQAFFNELKNLMRHKLP
jgi:transcriptional repressor NrdR